jgi:capsular polysaccharide transport system permease protein
MTSKPKAKKFRIKRNLLHPTGSAARAVPDLDDEMTPAPEPLAPRRRRQKPDTKAEPTPEAAEERTAETPEPDAPTKDAVAAAPSAEDMEFEAIRREGLTGRQLRMARRVAQKQGLEPTSDFDAVRLLRAKGIDPFERGNMLQLVVPQQGAQMDEAPQPHPNLPQTVPDTLPSTEKTSPAQRREREISDIQRDIARRRRRKIALLMTRLAFFVMLPTMLAGWYFYMIATPMYATDSEFLIIQNEGSGGSGALGGLLPTQFATSQDSIAVQSYLTSKDAMLRLDADEGFRAHFAQGWVDPIQRLPEDATNEQAYGVYKDNVKIGFDPTEGVMRMEVIAADPQVSQSFSEALISYAEERVNELSAQKREDQMRDAIEALEKAEADRRGAQERLVELQIEGATLDPEAVIAALRTQISEINALITEKEIQLDTLLNNPQPNQARVDGARSSLEVLRNRRRVLEAEMTDMSAGDNSLAQLSINIQMAQADLATRDMMLQSALQQLEQARTEANRQVRYLTVAVRPVAPQEATYPRAFENTILAFLIFAGIYLMISLTAAILREQVSS